MARQYYPSVLFTYRTQYILSLVNIAGAFQTANSLSGPADMESVYDGTAGAVAESQQGTVQ